ncbi:hypothetical protein [Psychrobacter pygoscelis]|uniref:hypothetical protein n=1 Tax=Psychrobacter pygoscelis TaxID=2488563 RepID=UPI0013F3F959|nr:hypothetical protein [Psychrobacter pygoscelis]
MIIRTYINFAHYAYGYHISPISKASVASSSIQGVIHRTTAIVSGEDGISTIILRR